jgi:hypothetical protein
MVMRDGLLASAALALTLATAASAVPLGGRPDLDKLAGVYKHPAAPGLQRPEGGHEDVFEVVKLSPRTVYFRIHTEDGDHICGIYGVAELEADALVYTRPPNPDPCRLRFQATAQGVVIDDVGGGCRRFNCGAGANLGFGDRVNFKFSEKRSIRYMDRLLKSREYAEAVREHGGARPAKVGP